MESRLSGRQENNLKYLNRIKNTTDDQPAYIKGFVNYMQKSSVITKQKYMLHAIRFINYIDKPLNEIDVDDYLNFLAENEYKNGVALTPSYRIQVYSALKKFSKYLYVSKKCSEDFMKDVERPKFNEQQQTIEKRKQGYFTENEVKQFLNATKEGKGAGYKGQTQAFLARDFAIVKVFLSTGIRCSALCALDVDNVNFTNKTLVVTDKGDKTKIFDLTEDVIDALKTWLKWRELLLVETKALFVSMRRTRITDNSVSRVITKTANTMTSKHITPHKLRATYGTQLYNATKDVLFVQDCMGHDSPKTTELYIRDRQDNLKKASEIMSKIMSD